MSSIRQKLAREHRALMMHNLRLKYGNIIRVGLVAFNAQNKDTCIDCGWSIYINDLIQSATWERRSVQGFYAHMMCHPIVDSTWLNDTDFIDVISLGEYASQKCRQHNAQVIARVLRNDYVMYVCQVCLDGMMHK